MKIYTLLFILLLANIAFAQKHSISVSYKPSLTYLGKQTQSFNHTYIYSRSGNTTFNNAASILYKLKTAARIKIGAGLEFSQQGQNIKFKIENPVPENTTIIYTTELNYFRIPLTIDYSILHRKNSDLSLYTGLNTGFAIKRKDNYNDIIFEAILLPPAEKRYKKIDVAIPVGFNFQRRLNDLLFANLGFEYMFGLTNSFSNDSSSKFGVLSEFKNSKQNRMSLIFGVGFNFGKQKDK